MRPLAVAVFLSIAAVPAAGDELQDALGDFLSGDPKRVESAEASLLNSDAEAVLAAIAKSGADRKLLDPLAGKVRAAAIPRWIAALGSESPALREGAERQLIDSGEMALEPCAKALSTEKDPEARARLVSITSEIREILSLGEPARTVEEAYRRFLTADFTGDGRSFWCVLSRTARRNRKASETAEMEQLRALPDDKVETLARERYGVGASEFRKMTVEQAVIARMTSRRHVEMPEKMKAAKLASIEIRDGKAFCEVEPIDDELIELKPYVVFVMEDGGWKYDDDETSAWDREHQEKR